MTIARICLLALILIAATPSSATAGGYPYEHYAMLKGVEYARVVHFLGKPEREKSLDDGLMGIWYMGYTGARAVMGGENCQLILIVGADHRVRDVDLAGHPGVCKDFAKYNKKTLAKVADPTAE